MRRPSGNGAVRSDSWSTSPPDAGFTPQYGQLEELQHRYGDRGFTVLGFPSNQFPQEFGSSDKIAKYCSTTWGVTFPMMSKVKVDLYCQHYGKSLSVDHWEETCDYYIRHFPFETYGKKWTERKGQAIHTESDFKRPLYEWGEDLFANAVPM